MIQLDEVHIEHVRGIRDLTLSLNRKSFAVHGPNGSGKSGVVDAIEFGLTGDITRLSGPGTTDISVKEHGPHVDARSYPDKALVRLEVYIPSLDKTATITRLVKSPKRVTITPDEPDVRAVLDEVALHPEITLTRRQIAKFILTQAGKRSEDIQTLLRLEAIGQTRARLKTALNTTGRKLADAENRRDSAADGLRRHLDLEKLVAADVLEVINKHRAVLGLEPLTEFVATTSFTEGMADKAEEPKGPDKESALRDLRALLDAVGPEEAPAGAASQVLEAVQRLVDEPDLLLALERRAFVETGLGYADADICPLCDETWDLDALRAHLETKLDRWKTVEPIEKRLKDGCRDLQRDVEQLLGIARSAARVATQLEDSKTTELLEAWVADLTAFSTQLRTVQGAVDQATRLSANWRAAPDELPDAVAGLVKKVEALGDHSAAITATKFLAVAEDRLKSLRTAKRQVAIREKANGLARAAYNAYCDASDSVLDTLYKDVEKSFAEWYRRINRDDEGRFTARLTPSEGKVDLTVDFHERGLFHPGAYHSEGHQDGMGLCLYLALMQQLLGDAFQLAVLDDVVMSVDKQHRRELCGLLKEVFPDTQFVITTHEEAWFHQMRSTGLVGRQYAVTFRGWTPEHGPKVNRAKEVWEDIEQDLENEDVPAAASRLRRYLEFVGGELAAGLGASVPYKPDGNHDLGDLLPPALSRYRSLLKKGRDSASKWKDADAERVVKERQELFDDRLAASKVEEWAVNKAVHYNEWANFGREDFDSVVQSFKDMLECLRCPKCGQWLHVSPRLNPEVLRCDCADISVNLAKPK